MLRIRSAPTGVTNGLLTIYVLQRRDQIAKFTVRLDGQFAKDDVPFLIAVEMDDQPLGAGPCGHPLIHCHLGRDHDHEPQFRVPMPAMKPWDALDWIMAQITHVEPVPWTDAQNAKGRCPPGR